MAGTRILSPEEVRALSPEQQRAYLRNVGRKVVQKNRKMTAILAAYDQKEPPPLAEPGNEAFVYPEAEDILGLYAAVLGCSPDALSG